MHTGWVLRVPKQHDRAKQNEPILTHPACPVHWWGLIRACLLLFICSTMNHSASDKHYSTAVQITSRGAVTHTHTHGPQQNRQTWAPPRQRSILLSLSHTKTCTRLTICTQTHNPTQITFFPLFFLFTHIQCFQSSFQRYSGILRVPFKHILTKYSELPSMQFLGITDRHEPLFHF